MNITSNFTHALMLVIARQIAQQAQTDAQGAQDYFDMQAQAMSSEEREIFGNAVIDFTIEIRS